MISIISTCYNSSKYLNRLFSSLCNQDTKNKFEIIFIDDGSTDNSLEIANRFSNTYTNIKVIHTKNNGLLYARIEGVKNANGQYIMFVDSDDCIARNSISILEKIIIKYNPDIIMFDYAHIKDLSNLIHYAEYDEPNLYVNNIPLITGAFVWNKIYRKSLISIDDWENCKNICYTEDTVLNLCFSKKASTLCKTNSCLYNYINNDDSLVNTTKTINISRMLPDNHFLVLDKYFDLEAINKYTSDFISSQFIWFTKNRIICLLKSKIMTGREKRSFLKKIMTSPIYDTKLSKYSLSLKNLVHLKEKHFLLITYLKIKHFFLKKT